MRGHTVGGRFHELGLTGTRSGPNTGMDGEEGTYRANERDFIVREVRETV